MKILLTGGGSGGHFYPIIAIAEALRRKMKENKLLEAKLYYMAPEAYNEEKLLENDITFLPNTAGKYRRYFSLKNISDIFKTIGGIISAIFTVFNIYPDVIFGKGGYGSFPALVAGKIFGIPVVIHESDSVPGKVNAWAGKFAKRIAVSFAEAGEYFPNEKVAYTGNPIREEIKTPIKSGAYEFLKLEPNVPIILVLGGSMGASIINETIIGILPELVEKYQIIHQTGKGNFKDTKEMADVILEKNQFKNRYIAFDYLNDLAMKMSAGVASLIISRAGSTIFEISAWGIPSILIPITESNGDHQRKNAFHYARGGGAEVIEEENLAPHVLLTEVNKIMDDKDKLAKMAENARAWSRGDSADLIADQILEIALSHEK